MKLTFDLERLTLDKQVYLGLALFAVCCILATAFRVGAFLNLGAVSYWVLFLVHPVFPAYFVPTDREIQGMRAVALIMIGIALMTAFDF